MKDLDKHTCRIALVQAEPVLFNKQESLKREGVPVELTELPNIGPVLAENLRRVDINSAEELRAAGAELGVRKTALTAERKAELRAFFDRVK